MIGILRTKFTGLFRSPGTFLLMTMMSVVFAFIIGGGSEQVMKIPANRDAMSEQENLIIHILEDNEVFQFEWQTKEKLETQIESGKGEFGLVLADEGFDIVVGIDSPYVALLENTVQQAYVKNEQMVVLTKATDGGNTDDRMKMYQHISDQPVFHLNRKNFHNDETWLYDSRLYPLFGFTLFFSVMTIAYSVFQMLVEKRTGVWDRMILSSVKKWEMYTANFLYSFLIGFGQISLVFCMFRFMFGIDFYGGFFASLLVLIPYVLAIVSLAVFLVGVVKSAQQFNALIAIVSVSMAMVGGAFWPLEIVESKWMLFLSKLIPLKYGLELLNGVTIYQNSISELLYPISILLLISIVLTGLGIHLMERRFIS